ncbi:MAG: caspase family protein [Bacteroidota bacterium]
MNHRHFISFVLALIAPLFLAAQCISGNCINGMGTYTYPSGAKYIGDFKNGKMNGWGMCTYSNGSIYKGEWKNGYPHGKGKKLLANKKEWSGRWVQGRAVDKRGHTVDVEQLLNGKKTEQLAAKTTPDEGCISGNCVDGYGIYVYKNKSARYKGYFKGEQAHGKGTIRYANGDVYTGDWVNGYFEGKGILTLNDGKKISGYWKASVHVGDANPFREEQPSRPQIVVNKEMKVWAVVIGVATYNHMPTLKYTDDDAYRMYAFLKSPEGGALSDDHIRILVDEDATKNRILNTLNEVFTQAGSNDLVILYFSGHGLPGAFLPSDFDGFDNRIYHDEIKEILERSPAKYKICIADACHSGGLLAMKGADANNALLKYYEALAQSSPGSALILSSKSSETSLESSGLRQGVFSHFLIRGLKGEADRNQDRIVSVQELFDFTYHKVRSYTGSRQSPVIKGNFDPRMPVSVTR